MHSNSAKWFGGFVKVVLGLGIDSEVIEDCEKETSLRVWSMRTY
jgi:hypothetical protein